MGVVMSGVAGEPGGKSEGAAGKSGTDAWDKCDGLCLRSPSISIILFENTGGLGTPLLGAEVGFG